jgi:hypothetical protein
MAEELFDTPTERLRQGDVFEPLLFVRTEKSAEGMSQVVQSHPCRALLLNQSCDIDKPNFKRLIVVPVIELSLLPKGEQNNVKKNRMFSRLFLPAHRERPDSFVSFNEPMTIDRSILENTTRVESLSERGRRALYAQYVRWLTRWQLTEIQCPRCDVAFNPSETLPVVND